MRTKSIVAWLILVFFSAALLFCGREKEEKKSISESIIGVKIYNADGNFQELFEEWQSLGINTVLASEAVLSNREFRDLAKKSNTTIFIILPIFHNPQELEKNPDLYAITDEGKRASDDWVHFVCPTREDYREQRISSIKQAIEKYQPDGISIDFIRYFVFWEKVYPERTSESLANTCFDTRCLDKFQKETGVEIPQQLVKVPEKAAWIRENHLQVWTEWKCSVITSMVKEISAAAKKSKPDVLVNVHAVPWREKDFSGAIKIIAGQDISAISEYTDLISPMCYSHMVKRKPSWIHSVVEDMHNRSRSAVVPSIQVKEAYLADVLSTEDFRDALYEALKAPSRGVLFWSWEALSQDPQKKDVIKALLGHRAS